MSGLNSFVDKIDFLNEHVGRVVAWLALIMVMVQFIVVLLRYVFGLGFIEMQESILFMHSAIFLVGAGYTLLHDGHVRVDIIYGAAKPTTKAWIDMLGVLIFLWPFCIVLTLQTWPYVSRAIAVFENSQEGTFMPIWLLKLTILAFPVLVSLQGLSLALKSLQVVLGLRDPDDPILEAEEEHGL